MRAAQAIEPVKPHTSSAMQIERAVQQRQQTVYEAPKLPETKLKKVEKPKQAEPEPVKPAEIKPVLKGAPKTPPKPKHPIAQPPQFTKPLSPVKITEGTPVTLEVEYEGFPPPHISWYRESFEIKPSNDFQVCTTLLPHCIIIIICFWMYVEFYGVCYIILIMGFPIR